MSTDLERAIRVFYTDKEFRLLQTRLRMGVRAIEDMRKRLPPELFGQLAGAALHLEQLEPDVRANVEWLIARLAGEPEDGDGQAIRHLRLILRNE